MTEENIEMTAMQRMLLECEGDADKIGDRISGVLEFLTLRAVNDAPYFIATDNGEAMVVFAANDDSKTLGALLPANFKDWNDALDEDSFITNADPGDEQPEQMIMEGTDESPTESE